MKSNASRRRPFLPVITGLLVTTLAAAASPQEIEKSGCDDRSLRGDYGFTIDGTVFAGPSPFMIKGVALTHFDGHGNLRQVDFTTRNGVPATPDWRPATGTYSIDCRLHGQRADHPRGRQPHPEPAPGGDRSRAAGAHDRRGQLDQQHRHAGPLTARRPGARALAPASLRSVTGPRRTPGRRGR
jgi:hypothetical protein